MNPELTNGEWTSEDNLRLLRAYKAHGPAWKQICAGFGQRGARAVKNQFFSVLRNYIQKLFKSGCPGFRAKEIHRIKPKVLANFLDYVFENSDSPVRKMDQPRSSVFDLIERMQAIEATDKPGELLLDSLNLNFQKGLQDLRNGKWANQPNVPVSQT